MNVSFAYNVLKLSIIYISDYLLITLPFKNQT